MSDSEPPSRLLLLMRHGKAESGTVDHARDLASRGRTQAALVGEYLAAQNVQVSHVLVSDAARTSQTWDAVVAAMPGFDGEVTFHEDIYTGGAGELAALLRAVEDRHQVVMVVGHEPTISSLTAALADDDSDSASIAQARIGMPTGGLAILSGPLSSWADLGDEALTLHTIVRP